MGLVIYLATSKYGNIRLGEGKTEYSTLSWLFMFICAGLGSSTLYWGVAEWAYYYQTPGLNIAPRSQQALEFSVPYSFFHWGISAWATYTLASLIMAYHFHVRKNKGLSLSGIIAAITGVRPQGPWGKLVDLMFLIATVGALTISLVVTAATFTRRSSSGGGGGGGGLSAPSYSVSVDDVKHGTVTVSPESASKGDTVTITATPDKGYVLESLTVLDKDGKALTLTDKGSGKYIFVMPAGKITVKAVFMDDNTMLNFFTDVHAEDYYYDAVLWAAQKGITGGMSDTLFAPNAACTRAQIVTFLWRAAGSPEPKALSSFADVPADAYYAKAVAWAVENGITEGTSDTAFAPGTICTRAHGVTFLYRAAKATASVGASAFTDVADSAYYADAVKWATEQGITKGVSSTLFGPDETCTRAQIVTFLYRLYGSK